MKYLTKALIKQVLGQDVEELVKQVGTSHLKLLDLVKGKDQAKAKTALLLLSIYELYSLSKLVLEADDANNALILIQEELTDYAELR